MKYLVTVRVTNEFITEVSAKDSDAAEEKVEMAWRKLEQVIQVDYTKLGKFGHENEDIEFDAEENE